MSADAPSADPTPAPAAPTPAPSPTPDPAPAPQPAPDPPSWYSSLPPDLANDPTIQRFKGKDPSDLAKSYLESRRMLGADKIVKPGENATEQDWARFYTELGRPEGGPDGYELAPPDGVPEDMPRDEAFEKQIVQELYDSGVPKQSAQRIYQKWFALEGERYKAHQQQMKQASDDARTQLQRKLGMAYESVVDLATRTVRELTKGGADLARMIELPMGDGSRLGDNPDFILMLGEIGKAGHEAGVVGDGRQAFALSPDEALRQIAKLDKEVFTMNTEDPEYRFKVEERDRLYRIAYPTNTRRVDG